MKILHAVNNFPPEFQGGTEMYLAALVREQRRAGHEVTVVAGSAREGVDSDETTAEGARVLRLRHDARVERYTVDLRHPRIAATIRALLRSERPDLVHVHHWLHLGAPIVTDAAALRIPAVVSLHDYTVVCPRFHLIRPCGAFCGDDSPVPLERCLACCALDFDGTRDEMIAEFRLRRAFFSAELSTAGAVLMPSQSAKRVLLATGILEAPPEIEVVPLGLIRPLAPAPAAPDPGGRLRLVHFGNLAPVKGVEVLLDALAGLDAERRKRVTLRLIGRPTDDAIAERIDDKCRALGGVEIVREAGYDAARLERLAAEADVAVFPSTASETYSLVVDEALALGLGVIVSDRGAAKERVGAAVRVVKTGDAAALGSAIAESIDRPDTVSAMRAAARAQSFTIFDHARRVDEIYARVRAAGAHPPAAEVAHLSERRVESGDVRAARLTADRERMRAELEPRLPEHDARFRFVPLKEFSTVPGGTVVVLAPHPDDEVIGCGGALAMHAARGDRVVVVHLTDGAGGRSGAERAKVAATRKVESRAAGARLGVTEFRALDFPDGALTPDGAFLSGFAGLLDTLQPDVVYAPSPFEHHPDHRATLWLAAKALASSRPGGKSPRVILFEVNEPQPPGWLLDVTPVLAKKRAALECFASQRGALDVVEKALTANRARTVNVDLPQVEAAEAYREIPAPRLVEWIAGVTRLLHAGERFDGEVAAAAVAPDAPVAAAFAARASVPVTAVISTWNKKDDVRENLLALTRQSMPPREIVVVDNHSKDGTADMIRAEFPAVKLIEMPHDRFGACETFNLGMKAATQPFTAIMDDDVVAPPDWLERLWTRMQREPATTAMVSSEVIEPGMPEEFIRDLQVRRERYMATFRGCGTLARSDALAQAGYYDERFFIYGNERDLSARILGLGYRILQFPEAQLFHKTPFGMKAGKRSLYFHVRNFWLYAFKNCSFRQIVRAGFLLALKGLGLGNEQKHASDATGTIGIDRAVKETPGGLWIAVKATLAAVAMLPYCLKHRRVCTAPDFEPPVR